MPQPYFSLELVPPPFFFADQSAQQYQEVQIPEVVKKFILLFHRSVLENNVYELQSIYEHSFNKLTEKFYANESWPEPEAISSLVNDGKTTFCWTSIVDSRELLGRRRTSDNQA